MIERFNIFNAPLYEIKQALAELKSEDDIDNRDRTVLIEDTLDIESFVPHIYNPESLRAVFWKPKNYPITIMTSNLVDGWHTLGYVLNQIKGFEMIEISLEEDFRLFNYNHERLVRVMWDYKWDFFEKGKPFPFENINQYKTRLKKKRLTADMIIEYVKFFGYNISDPDFFQTNIDAIYYTLYKT